MVGRVAAGKRPPSSTSSPVKATGCEHTRRVLSGHKHDEALRLYELAMRLATDLRNVKVAKTMNNSAGQFHPRCSECGNLTSSVRICLVCSHMMCWNHSDEASSHSKDHYLAADLIAGEGYLYCYGCEDYMVDESFERIRKSQFHQLPPMPLQSPNLSPRSQEGNKQDIKQQEDNDDDDDDVDDGQKSSSASNGKVGVVAADINANARVPQYQATTGLRGFHNMGATCFISVVLQSFIHNPLVRNFFLGGGHDQNECTHQGPCLACSVDGLFSDFFKSCDVQGYGPTSLIVTAWKVKRQLAGSEQQDAHEFLQFMLNEFHKSHFEGASGGHNASPTQTITGKRPPPPPVNTNDLLCSCISHRTFCGELESRIKCHSCDKVTTTVDPMMDLSLEIKASKKSKTTTFPTKEVALEDCLERFTSTEKLDTMYYCNQCNTRRTVDKQLSIRRMPVVLSIQLKRFQHHASSASTKIETPVQFPLFLDMAKYTTTTTITTTTTKDGSLVYELFGVISHQGTLNTGHYTCMMKTRQGQWFHFDDSMITSVTAAQVTKSKNAYLLFYIIRQLP